ncbi:MAG: hypothetical protein DRN66_03135 [Candidatus Nanohalarchaeota archaeon]|nr:MAG: hypothetical protein DRN66_03135 [Candidatus Nanohaloarchaeota archaeon]
MGFLEKCLEKIAIWQKKYTVGLFVLIVLFTLFVGVGIKDISLQTDVSKEMPQDLPVFQLNNKITDIFGGQDTIILLIELDDSGDIKNTIKDIRDPYIIQSLIYLETVLNSESEVESVNSAARYFRSPFYTIEQVKAIIEANPKSKAFFSEDYKSTLVFVKADVGKGEEKIIKLAKLIQKDIDAVPIPTGIKVSITGNPPMRVVIMQLLSHDAAYTLFIAAIIILFLLIFMQKSITKGLLVFMPLMLGLIWTIGSMGWMKMPLSIATVGIGAMILGLGVEYGVFMVSRYKEEREKGMSQKDSLKTAVPGVGSAILGSGLTTIIGFIALTVSTMPMMQKLGLSLALGIIFCLIAAVFAAPVIILMEEDFEYWHTHRKYRELSVKKQKHERMIR